MQLQILQQNFSICKLKDLSQVDYDGDFLFIGKTDEELSLVCRSDSVPANSTARSHGWRAFRISGVLDFSLIGILSKISSLLAENQIGIFAVSTYNTDYILTKAADFNRALEVLEGGGYTVCEPPCGGGK